MPVTGRGTPVWRRRSARVRILTVGTAAGTLNTNWSFGRSVGHPSGTPISSISPATPLKSLVLELVQPMDGGAMSDRS